MDKRSKLIEKILRKYLPPFSFRAGYSATYINPFPRGLQHVLVDHADRESLETFFLRFELGPSEIERLTHIFDLLSPGGVGFLSLHEEKWTEKQLSEICRALGLKIKYFRSIPGCGESRKKEYITVVQKSSHIARASRKKILSVILPFHGGSSYDRSADNWYQFLEKKDMLEISEIIVVDDGIMRNESIVEVEYRDNRSRINFIGHYMPFGRITTIQTGMMHATGRYILVDESREGVPPAEVFPLLNAMMHRETDENLTGCAIGTRSWDPRTKKKAGKTIKERFVRFICGSLKPESNFRMFHFQLAGQIFENNFSEHKLLPLLYLKRKNIPIKDVPIEGTVTRIKDPGLLRLLRLKIASYFY